MRKSNVVFDKHHILWQARNWKRCYSKLLRNHPYMKIVIPRATLHDEIHNCIADIPCPGERLCKKALVELESRIADKTIDVEHDSFEDRINFLLEIWPYESCPMTINMLLLQRSIVTQFYNGRP